MDSTGPEVALSTGSDDNGGTSDLGEPHDASDAVKRPIDKNLKRFFIYTPNVFCDNV